MKTKLKNKQPLGGIMSRTWALALTAGLALAGAAHAQNEFGPGAGNGTMTGDNNTAYGAGAFNLNTNGNYNVANGYFALYANTGGNGNLANGAYALNQIQDGVNNIALGYGAGSALTNGSYNIDIGNNGAVDESGTIRIGTPAAHSATFIAGITGVTVSGTVNPVVINTN